MAETLLIKTKAEEELMIQLLKEFATKVVVSRRGEPSEIFKSFCKQGIYGVWGLEVQQPTGHKLFELALPDAFVGYIGYEIEKLRGFLTSVKQQNGSIQK
jgi:hypothetical protein